MPLPLPDTPHIHIVEDILKKRASWLKRDSAARFRIAAEELAGFPAATCDFSGDVVRIGQPEPVDDVVAHRRRGGGGQRHHRRAAQLLHQVADGQVVGDPTGTYLRRPTRQE